MLKAPRDQSRDPLSKTNGIFEKGISPKKRRPRRARELEERGQLVRTEDADLIGRIPF